MRKDGFDDPALVTHVGHHGEHVVISRPHQGRAEDDGQVADLHLVGSTVIHHFDQVAAQMVQSLIIDLRELSDMCPEVVQPLVGLLDFGGIDKNVVHFSGENGVGQFAEERLEEGGHHVHVVPFGVV